MMPTSAHDEEPEPAGCEAVRQRLDGLLAEFAALMAGIAADPDRPDRARRMTLLTAALRENRAWLAGHVLAEELAGSIEARAEARGYQRGLAAGQRKGRHAASRSGAVLRLAPVVAAIGWLLRPLVGAARQVRAHGAVVKLTAAHLKLAAAVTASTATLATVGAVVITHYAGSPGSGQAGSGTGAASVPGWHTSASPFPPSTPVALLTKPKPKRAARGKELLAAGAPVPVYSPALQPASSSPPSSPSAAVSVQAGPAVLTVGAVSLDLSVTPQAMITLSASGAGWVSWRISTSGTDLDFSATHGVLQAGQSVTLTVSVDPAQALDGNTSQTFEINGQPVTVALPALTLPSAAPVAAPSVVPTALPS